MPGFKSLTQSGITLSVGQSLTLKLTLEVGAITERIDVIGQAPLLDTTSVSSGQNFDQALIAGSADGLEHADPAGAVRAGRGQPDDAGAGDLRGRSTARPTPRAPSSAASAASTTRSTAPPTPAAAAASRSSPNADMIQEMRVETSNFDAAQGHGTGGTIAMMTARGHELAARHGELPVLDQQASTR